MEDREALRRRAIELRLAGLSTAQIAQELGIRRSSSLNGWLVGTPPPVWTRRPNAKDGLRAKAREMRLAGATYPEIAAALGVSKSSVSLWVRHLPHQARLALSDDPRRVAVDAYLARRRQEKLVERQTEKLAWAREVGPLTDRELLIAGAVAYWAEGGKSKPWRFSESVRFINSDADMIRLFLRWLRLIGVPSTRLRYQVSIHESADVQKAERFWADVVHVPVTAMQPSTLKRHRPLTNRKNVGDAYHGCLTISVLDPSHVYRRAEGIWWAVVAGARGGA